MKTTTAIAVGAGLGLVAALGAVFLRRAPTVAPLETVESVDLLRYQGRWFEIAHYPAWFEHASDKNTTAQYTALADGRIRVVNQTTGENGRVRVAQAIASVADPQTNAKLKVKFSPFLPGGDYWIIDLAPDYSYAVVGDPRRRFLWILSRTTQLPEPVFNQISARLIAQHYDPARLIHTTQE